MQIVIELSDETYKDIKEENGIYGINNGLSARITGKVVGAIQNGTPLPKEHGDLVDYEELKNNAGEYGAYAEATLSHIKPKIIIEADKTEGEE